MTTTILQRYGFAYPRELSGTDTGPAMRLVEPLATLRVWQQRVDMRQHLRELDEHLLRDVGMTRADAEHEAAKPFWEA